MVPADGRARPDGEAPFLEMDLARGEGQGQPGPGWLLCPHGRPSWRISASNGRQECVRCRGRKVREPAIEAVHLFMTTRKHGRTGKRQPMARRRAWANEVLARAKEPLG